MFLVLQIYVTFVFGPQNLNLLFLFHAIWKMLFLVPHQPTVDSVRGTVYLANSCNFWQLLTAQILVFNLVFNYDFKLSKAKTL